MIPSEMFDFFPYLLCANLMSASKDHLISLDRVTLPTIGEMCNAMCEGPLADTCTRNVRMLGISKNEIR